MCRARSPWSRHAHIPCVSGGASQLHSPVLLAWHPHPLHKGPPPPASSAGPLPSPAMAAASGVITRRRLAPLALLLLMALVLLLAPAAGGDTNSTDPAAAAGATQATRRACTYTVTVKTSCSSPLRTSDAVSLAFGDMYRNEVHAPRLPSTNGEALARCSTDTFHVSGPCGYGVCYLYLRRAGGDGWAPEWVRVVLPGPNGPVASTFYFGDPLPDGVWYGHNRCPKAVSSNAAAGSHDAKPAAGADARQAGGDSASP